MTIWDRPQYQVRGLVDDISRGQRPTLDNFKFFIRFLSRNKQNVFILYIEDIFYFKSFPRIGEGRGSFDSEDILKNCKVMLKNGLLTFCQTS